MHLFTYAVLLDGCGSHVPVKSEFRILLMRECKVQVREGPGSLANLAAHGKGFKSAI